MSVSIPGRIAIGCVAVTAGVVAVNLGPPLESLLTPAPGTPEPLEEGVGNLAARMEERVAMINGRSLFFVPDAPPPPPPPARVEEDPGPPPEPPKPTRYAGPSLVAMINDIAWFNDGLKLAPGESDGDLLVKRLVPPWEAVVEWQDVEFTISLFERDAVVFKDGGEDPDTEQDTVALDVDAGGTLESEDQE